MGLCGRLLASDLAQWYEAPAGAPCVHPFRVARSRVNEDDGWHSYVYTQRITAQGVEGLARKLKTALAALALMLGAAIGAVALKPAPAPRSAGPAFQLKQIVPMAFGDWKTIPHGGAQLVNPQTQELLDKLYSQLLTRVYVDDKGYRIMLTMAYGDDQRGGLQAHMPDVCYPAQGFNVLSREWVDLHTQFGVVPARRLNTAMGARVEPITYWFNFGNQVLASDSPWEKRIVEIRFGLTGQVPNGILVRVSSIDRDTQAAYEEQERFIQEMLAAMTPIDRQRLAGLSG